jgi:hypothetical protein
LNNGQLITNFGNNNVPIGYKLTISRKYLSYFEKWLFNRYITYNNLFPDYEGAVKNSIYEFKDLINKEHQKNKKEKRGQTPFKTVPGE